MRKYAVISMLLLVFLTVNSFAQKSHEEEKKAKEQTNGKVLTEKDKRLVILKKYLSMTYTGRLNYRTAVAEEAISSFKRAKDANPYDTSVPFVEGDHKKIELVYAYATDSQSEMEQIKNRFTNFLPTFNKMVCNDGKLNVIIGVEIPLASVLVINDDVIMSKTFTQKECPGIDFTGKQ